MAALSTSFARKMTTRGDLLLLMVVALLACIAARAAGDAASGSYRLLTPEGNDCLIAGIHDNFVVADGPDSEGRASTFVFWCGFDILDVGERACKVVAAIPPPSPNTTDFYGIYAGDYPFNTTGILTTKAVNGNSTFTEIFSAVTEPETGLIGPAVFYCLHDAYSNNPANCSYVDGMAGRFFLNPIGAAVWDRDPNVTAVQPRDLLAFVVGPVVGGSGFRNVTPPGIYFYQLDYAVNNATGFPIGGALFPAVAAYFAIIPIDDYPPLINFSLALRNGLLAVGDITDDNYRGIVTTYDCTEVVTCRDYSGYYLPECLPLGTITATPRRIAGAGFGAAVVINPPLPGATNDSQITIAVTANNAPNPLSTPGALYTFLCNPIFEGGYCLQVQAAPAPFNGYSTPSTMPTFGTGLGLASTVIGSNNVVVVGNAQANGNVGLAVKYICPSGVLCAQSRQVFYGDDDTDYEADSGVGTRVYVSALLTGVVGDRSSTIVEFRAPTDDGGVGSRRRSSGARPSTTPVPVRIDALLPTGTPKH